MVIQFQVASSKIIYIQATLNRFSRLYLYIYAFIHTCNNNKERSLVHRRGWREGRERENDIIIF